MRIPVGTWAYYDPTGEGLVEPVRVRVVGYAPAKPHMGQEAQEAGFVYLLKNEDGRDMWCVHTRLSAEADYRLMNPRDRRRESDDLERRAARGDRQAMVRLAGQIVGPAGDKAGDGPTQLSMDEADLDTYASPFNSAAGRVDVRPDLSAHDDYGGLTCDLRDVTSGYMRITEDCWPRRSAANTVRFEVGVTADMDAPFVILTVGVNGLRYTSRDTAERSRRIFLAHEAAFNLLIEEDLFFHVEALGGCARLRFLQTSMRFRHVRRDVDKRRQALEEAEKELEAVAEALLREQGTLRR